MNNTSKKIYIVTQGLYSDYHIVTVTSSREKAKILAEKASTKYDKARVETYMLDDFDMDSRPYYEVCFHNGDVVFVSDGVSPYTKTSSCYYDQLREFEEALNQVKYKPKDYYNYVIVVRAEDEEQAAKIAQDKIAQYRAEQEGLT